jgi:hypothetical protein
MLVTPEHFTGDILEIPDAESFNVGDGENKLLLSVIRRTVPEILLFVLEEEKFGEYQNIEGELLRYHDTKVEFPPYQYPEQGHYGPNLEDWWQLFYGRGKFHEAILNRVFCSYLARDEFKYGTATFGVDQSEPLTASRMRRMYVNSWNRYAFLIETSVVPFLTDHPSFKRPSFQDVRFAEFLPMFDNLFGLTE